MVAPRAVAVAAAVVGARAVCGGPADKFVCRRGAADHAARAECSNSSTRLRRAEASRSAPRCCAAHLSRCVSACARRAVSSAHCWRRASAVDCARAAACSASCARRCSSASADCSPAHGGNRRTGACQLNADTPTPHQQKTAAVARTAREVGTLSLGRPELRRPRRLLLRRRGRTLGSHNLRVLGRQSCVRNWPPIQPASPHNASEPAQYDVASQH